MEDAPEPMLAGKFERMSAGICRMPCGVWDCARRALAGERYGLIMTNSTTCKTAGIEVTRLRNFSSNSTPTAKVRHEGNAMEVETSCE